MMGAGLVAFALLYAIGTARLWLRAGWGRGIGWSQVVAFSAATLFLCLALFSPLHEVSERAFSAHMVQHELLVVVIAPLLVLARPGTSLLFALPYPWRSPVGTLVHALRKSPALRRLCEPAGASLTHGAAIWLWHWPPAFEAAAIHPVIHLLQHGSFLGTAWLFWAALASDLRRSGTALFCLFVTGLHTGFLGVLLSLAPFPLYPRLATRAAGAGIDPLTDQQWAGLIMWVPAGFAYALAGLLLAALWILNSSRNEVPHA